MREPIALGNVGLALVTAVLVTAAPMAESRLRQSTSSTPRLAPCADALCRPDGSRFDWRGITAFALAAQIAGGRDEEARRFVRWANEQGFNVLRVLAMNHGWLDLPPEQGRRALPRLFAVAAEFGMYVQVVALAGTAVAPFRTDRFLREQVEAIGVLCGAADNCVMEIANEPYHATQADLDDPARMRALAALVPARVPLAWGAAADHRSASLAGGTFVVAHLARSGERWQRVGRREDLAGLSRRLGKYVVDNEPIGAAEQAEPSRRENDPAVFFAQAAMAGILGLGATFHCEDCLHARMPGPTQQRCAEAFTRGARFVASDRGSVSGSGGSGLDARVIEPLPADTEVKVFGRQSARTAVAIALGTGAAKAVRWRPGWTVRSEEASGPEVHAWIADRSP